MNYKELIELLRYGSLCPVSGDGCEDKLKAATAIESLLAENERLKHNLATTEQTMREYQELAAKRLEEIAKYRDAPVVAVKLTWGGLELKDVYSTLPKGTQLIVKPGEEK